MNTTIERHQTRGRKPFTYEDCKNASDLESSVIRFHRDGCASRRGEANVVQNDGIDQVDSDMAD